ncbi:MAG: tyrosine-type recombinase/integrase, partial [Chloroflexota bacterium]|nr:tyrosine-type recombinase/integrase [Chloroflexota bacterium]
AWTDLGLVFDAGAGDIASDMFVRNVLRRSAARLGLPHIAPHGLRHSGATMLLNAGVSAKTVSRLLGHANVSMTLNLYVHPDDRDLAAGIEPFSALFAAPEDGPGP